MRRSAGRLTMAITMIAAIALTMLPIPQPIAAFRPDWVLLLLIFWTLLTPDRYSVGTAWIAGIVVDVVQGTYLGQHALAMTAVVFVASKLHLQLRVFPLPQLTLVVAAMVSLYQFLLFWINGVAGVTAEAVVYWGPAVSAGLVWPFLYALLNGFVYRPRASSG